MNEISPQEQQHFYLHLEQLGLRDGKGVERRDSGYIESVNGKTVAEYRSADRTRRRPRTIGYYRHRLAALEALCAERVGWWCASLRA
jgi:hypothetical protein